jgi:hypothetical protein
MKDRVMAKRFVTGTANLTPEKEKEFIAYIRSIGLAWWHWLPNFWLIKDSKDAATAASLRDALRNEECLVMEINEDITWANRGNRNSAGKSPTDWLKNSWTD